MSGKQSPWTRASIIPVEIRSGPSNSGSFWSWIPSQTRRFPCFFCDVDFQGPRWLGRVCKSGCRVMGGRAWMLDFLTRPTGRRAIWDEMARVSLDRVFVCAVARRCRGRATAAAEEEAEVADQCSLFGCRSIRREHVQTRSTTAQVCWSTGRNRLVGSRFGERRGRRVSRPRRVRRHKQKVGETART